MKRFILSFLVLVGSILFGCASSSPRDWTSAKTASILVMSQRAVILRKAPILLVIHIAEDDQWQFLAGEVPGSDPSIIVPLEQILQIDGSIMQLSDLPDNWKASRPGSDKPWERSPL